MAQIDSIQLEVFKNRFAAIAEEMGVVLRKAAYSPNIKERRDFSCALFDDRGRMIAQAAHIPVHLGSMPLSVEHAIHTYLDKDPDAETNNADGLFPNHKGRTSTFLEGDVVVVNDPFRGGTHLPDITMISPVFIPSNDSSKTTHLFGFVASRAHHADVGGGSPGSMAVASDLYQEGIIIPPIKLYSNGIVNQDVWDLLLANVRTPRERSGDLRAQVAANQRGIVRIKELVQSFGTKTVSLYMSQLLAYAERMTRGLLAKLPAGTYTFEDYMDDDGIADDPIPLIVTITISGDQAIVDFTGSAVQQTGNINAVYAITQSAVHYVFRCLLDIDVPNNSGCLQPIEIIAPLGSVVNAQPPAAVAAGNVETSQRIVDVLLGALAKAAPDRIPAASQGTMNNLTIGGWDPAKGRAFTYYETLGGGTGAHSSAPGLTAIHSHMTNTLNTPIEALEFAYPLRVLRYEIRRGSGGEGRFSGGDGLCRDIQTLVSAQASLLTERRKTKPYGLFGGSPGKTGENVYIHEGDEQTIKGKDIVQMKPGDILSIRTPGGGGYGSSSSDHDD